MIYIHMHTFSYQVGCPMISEKVLMYTPNSTCHQNLMIILCWGMMIHILIHNIVGCIVCVEFCNELKGKVSFIFQILQLYIM